MIDLDELKRLAGLVTPGGWVHVRNPENTRWIIDSAPSRAIACTAGYEPDNEANAALICLLRNNLPTIIAALETARLVRDVSQTLPAAKLDEVAASAVDWDGSDIPGDEPAKWETEAGVIRDMVAEIRAYRAIIAALPGEG